MCGFVLFYLDVSKKLGFTSTAFLSGTTTTTDRKTDHAVTALGDCDGVNPGLFTCDKQRRDRYFTQADRRREASLVPRLALAHFSPTVTLVFTRVSLCLCGSCYAALTFTQCCIYKTSQAVKLLALPPLYVCACVCARET